MRFPFTISIRSLVVMLCTLVAVASGLILALLGASVSRDITERESAAVLRALGQEAAGQLGRSLYVQWRELEGLVRFGQQSDNLAALRSRLETVAQLNERYAWIGLAAPDGRVLTATDGVLEGASVAERPWFRNALQGPFAGDVHDAVLLQRFVAPNAREPLRLIDFAAPVRRADGTFVGVLGSHVSWVAVREVVRDSLRDTGRDVLLVNRAGTILVGPPELEGQSLSLPSIMAARQGAARTAVETWPDGQSYLTAVVGPVAHRNLPSFGWSLVVRQKAEEAAAPARAITRRMIASLGGVAVVVLLGSLLLGSMLARPLRRLGESASALADGRLAGPVPDLRAYREVRVLADALARLQAQQPAQPSPAGAAPARGPEAVH